VPFCEVPYGCAYDEIMVDPKAVYTKIDDDIIFIKDGSFEHLIYQVRACLLRGRASLPQCPPPPPPCKGRA
jgi:hypothetical protein